MEKGLKLHDDNGRIVRVGADLGAIVNSDVGRQEVNSSEFAEVAPGRADRVASPQRLESFCVYWDVAEKQYKVYQPLVVDPDRNSVGVELPAEGITSGAYSLVVEYDKDNGGYSAKIKQEGAYQPSDKTVMVVKLFRIRNGGQSPNSVEQYHVGAIAIQGNTVTGEEGETDGSDAESLNGKLEFAGRTGSGLVVKTYKNSGTNHVRFGLKGQTDDQSFGVHDVVDSEGSATGVKVFSTSDIEMKGGGGGSSSIAYVFTGAQIEVDIPGKKLKIKFTTKKITVAKVEDVSGTTDAELDLAQCDVVESSEYDTGDHQFRNNLTGLVVLGQTSAEGESPVEVFTAKEHSTEA